MKSKFFPPCESSLKKYVNLDLSHLDKCVKKFLDKLLIRRNKGYVGYKKKQI